jgi:hypothetical protein
MSDLRTDLEKEMTELLSDLTGHFDGFGKIGRQRFVELVGRMNRIRIKLLNKRFGCIMGKHAQACDCR